MRRERASTGSGGSGHTWWPGRRVGITGSGGILFGSGGTLGSGGLTTGSGGISDDINGAPVGTDRRERPSRRLRAAGDGAHPGLARPPLFAFVVSCAFVSRGRTARGR